MKNGPPTPINELVVFTTEELRRRLSHVINRAAYGEDPVIVTRRGHRIAAVVSFLDLVLLCRIKMYREQYRKEQLEREPSNAKHSAWATDLGVLLG